MKFLGEKSIVFSKPGTIKIIPSKLEDLFFLHDKLISPGDTISAVTSRKIHASSESASKKKPARVQLELEIKITTVYPVEPSSSMFRIKGNSTVATRDVKAGVSHTLEIELNKDFCLGKEFWDEKAIYALNHPPVPVTVLSKGKAAIKLKEFTDVLSKNSGRACYGFKNVETAHESNAIETLMITDDLLRSSDIITRKKYSELVDSVKEASGEAFVFPPKHEKLTQLTGITAILRFPMSYLDDYEE